LGLALSILNAYTVVSMASPEKESAVLMGAISVNGEVMVNGTSAFSSSNIFSGSTIETGPASSAVVRLGPSAGIELLPNSVLRLSFDEKAVHASLDKGQTRVSTQTGIKAVVQTRDGTVLAGDAQPNLFLVSVECGNTSVSTRQGDVELQAANTRRMIPGGHRDSIGAPAPGCIPLKDDDDDDDDDEGISGRAIAGILTGAVAAILITIIIVDRNDDVVSPTK
jgi:ferric-dicitrate binding protein FerR (iron transport regulator)